MTLLRRKEQAGATTTGQRGTFSEKTLRRLGDGAGKCSRDDFVELLSGRADVVSWDEFDAAMRIAISERARLQTSVARGDDAFRREIGSEIVTGYLIGRRLFATHNRPLIYSREERAAANATALVGLLEKCVFAEVFDVAGPTLALVDWWSNYHCDFGKFGELGNHDAASILMFTCLSTGLVLAVAEVELFDDGTGVLVTDGGPRDAVDREPTRSACPELARLQDQTQDITPIVGRIKALSNEGLRLRDLVPVRVQVSFVGFKALAAATGASVTDSEVGEVLDYCYLGGLALLGCPLAAPQHHGTLAGVERLSEMTLDLVRADQYAQGRSCVLLAGSVASRFAPHGTPRVAALATLGLVAQTLAAVDMFLLRTGHWSDRNGVQT